MTTTHHTPLRAFIAFTLVLFFAVMATSMVSAVAPALSSLTTGDNNGDGTVDRLVAVFTLDLTGTTDGTGFTVAGSGCSIGSASESVAGTMTFVLTGCAVGTGILPTLTYTNVAGDIYTAGGATPADDLASFGPSASTDGAGPAIVSATSTSTTTVLVVFSEPVSDASVVAGDITFNFADAAADGVASLFTTGTANDNAGTFTVTGGAIAVAESTGTVAISGAGAISDGSVVSTQIATVTVADGIAATVVSATTGDADADGKIDRVSVVYSEAVTDADYNAVAVTGYVLPGTGSGSGTSTVVYTLTEGSADTAAAPALTWTGANAQDGGSNNLNIAGAPATATDGAGPAIVSATSTSTTTVLVVFSEPVSDASVVAGDVTFDFTDAAADGVASLFTTGTANDNAGTFTVTGGAIAVAESTGTVAISGAGAISDGSVVSTQIATVTVADGIAATVVSATTGDADADGKIDRVSVVYSEAVTDADYNAVAVTGYVLPGTGSGSGTSTVVYTLTEGSADTAAAPALTWTGANAQDGGSNNLNIAGAPATATDGAGPAIVSATSTSTTTVLVVFSEPVSDASVVAGDVTFDFTDAAADGVASLFTTGTANDNAGTFTVTGGAIAVAESTGTVAISGAGAISDGSVVSTQIATVTVADGIAATVVSATTGDADADGKIDRVSVVYSEAVTDADYNAVAVTGYVLPGTGSGSGTSTVVYTLTEGSADTAAAPALTWTGANAQDGGSNNLNIAGAPATATDGAGPAIVSATSTSTTTVLVVFSEPVSDASVVAGDVTFDFTDAAADGVASLFTTGTANDNAGTFTVTGGAIAVAESTGTVAISGAGAISDGSVVSTQIATVTVADGIAPTVVITDDEAGVANIAGGDVTFTFTFSEAVTGFDDTDVTVVGGAKGAFNPVSGTVYTLVVTPTASSTTTITVDVAGAAGVDANSNGNTAAVQATQVVDTLAPGVVITDDEAGVANIAGGDVTFTFTFSQAVTGFDDTDVTVVGGAKGAFNPVSGTVYTLVVTPTASSTTTITVDVAGAAGVDANSNGNTAAVQATQVVDTLAPGVVITDDEAGVANIAGGDVTFTFTFSQAVTGFDDTDVTVVGGAKGAFNPVSGTVYTLVVTPTASSTTTITVDVAGAAGVDANSNGNTAAVQATQVVDTLAPGVVITDDEAGVANIAGGDVTFTFTFSQAVTGFDDTDVTVVGGAKGAFNPVSGTVYTLVVTPTASSTTTITVDVAGAAGVDANSNGNTAAVQATQVVDTLAPGVVITDDEAGVANIAGGDVTFTFTFSQAVTGFDDTDVTVVGGAKGAFNPVSGTVYTLVVTPTASSTTTITVDVAGAAGVDANSNGNTAAVQATQVVDTLAPGVVITDDEAGVANIAGGDVTFTFTFSQAVTGFDDTDVTVVGGAKGAFNPVSGTVYTLVVTPTASSTTTITVDVAGAAGVDANSNGNTAAVQATQVVDTLAPGVVITDDEAGVANIAGGDVTFTFTFSQAVTGFDDTDVTVVGGAKGAFNPVSGTVYTLVVTPTASSTTTITVDVAGAAGVDANSNGNTAAVQATQVVDTLAPGVVITDDEAGVANIAGGDVTFTFTFSQAVTGFDDTDVTVVGGAKGAFNPVSGTVYTLVVTPTASSTTTITVDVAGAAGVDANSNGNTAAVQATQVVDTLAPVVSAIVLSPNGVATIGTPITIAITADAAGYTAGPITVNGVGVTGFTDNGGGSYTATYTVGGADADRASNAVPASVVLYDAAGNGNVAYTTVTANTVSIDLITATVSALNSASGTLTTGGILNNLNNVTTGNAAAFSGLYFEKVGYGKITFSSALDLTDSTTLTFLQNLGTSLDLTSGRVALDVSTAADFAGKGAVLKMYNMPAVTQDNLLVLNELDVADPTAFTSFAYDAGTRVVTIEAAHFTSFDFAPTFTANRTGANTIVLTFSEPVTASDAATAAWTLSAGSVSAVTQPSSSTTLTITTAGLAGTSATPTVTYVAASGTVKDAELNEIINGVNAVAADGIVPTVTKLGTGAADVTATATSTTNLIFSEAIDATSRTAVVDALTAGADQTLAGYSWNGGNNDLTITGHATLLTTFANDVVVTVTDLAGNSATLLLVDSALEATQVAPSGGAATVTVSTPEVVITNPVDPVTVTVGAVEDATIDVSAFVTAGEATIPVQITINSDVADVVIPAGVVANGSSWNGIINAPTVTTVTLPTESGQTKTLSSAIELGLPDTAISFDKAVRILMPDEGNKRAGYKRTSGSFTEITAACSADVQATMDTELLADKECKITVGSDLVIWTKHFTTFASYTQTATTTSSSRSGGGGGGIAPPPSTSGLISVMTAGMPTSVSIKNSDVPVQGLTLALNVDAKDIGVTVSNLKSANPTSATMNGKVFAFLQMDKKGFENTQIDSAKLRFSVTKAWLTANSLTAEKVGLYRYTTQWDALATKFVSEDATNVYFEATTPGFSYFAIAESAVTTTPTTTTPVVQETTTPPAVTGNVVAPTTPKTEEKGTVAPPAKTTTPAKSGSNAFWIIAIVAIIAAVVGVVWYRAGRKY